MPRALANEARSAYEAVDRGLVLLALVWQALWIAGAPQIWPMNQDATEASVALWLVAATWLLVVVWRVFGFPALKLPARWANVVALAVAAATLLAQATTQPEPVWGPSSNLVLLSACMGGLMLGSLAATVWMLAVVLLEAIVVLGVVDPRIEPIPSDVLFPLYALSLSVVVITARLVLTRDAGRADRASADLLDAERKRLTAEGMRAALHRQERQLHETVLNTLTAIVRGGITGSAGLRQRLQARCRESVDVLEQLGRRATGTIDQARDRRLDHDLLPLLVELEATGIRVVVECDDLSGIPDDVYDAVRTAGREALSNVLRHASATTVTMQVQLSGQPSPGLHAEITDDGRGFAMPGASTGFGIRGAVIDALAEVGGRATIDSVPQQGTVVRMDWVTTGGLEQAAPRRSVAAAAFAIPLLASFGLFNLAVVILTWPDVLDPARAVIAFGIFLALSALVAVTSLRGTIPWWVVIIVAASSALLYRVQTSSVTDAHGEWSDWSSAAVIALFVVAAGAGPGWSWLVLLATWLVIQGDVLHELLAAGTAMIISAALFGRNIRANEASVVKTRSLQLQQRTALVVAEEASEGIRRRYLALDASGARHLLAGIADGMLDPDGEGIRRWAALEERYIRTVMRVDPTLDGVRALAVELAASARESGLFLDVDLAPEPPPRQLPGPGDVLALRWAVENSVAGGVGRLSARTEGSEYVLRLLTPIPMDRHGHALSLPRRGVILDPADVDMLWEIRGVRGESHDGSDRNATTAVGDHR